MSECIECGTKSIGVHMCSDCYNRYTNIDKILEVVISHFRANGFIQKSVLKQELEDRE